MNKHIVLLAGPGSAANILYHALAGEFAVARVVREDAVPRAGFLGRRIKRLGVRKVLGQMAFRGLAVPWLERTGAVRIEEIERQFGLDESAIPDVVTTRVPSVNSEQCMDALRQLAPVAVVISGTRIISEKVLRCIPAPFINLHAGITPLYRGVHGAYWALVAGKREACGATVHLVDAGVDTGDILGQALIHPTDKDNFVTYPYLQLAVGLPLLKQAVQSALEGRLVPLTPPAGDSRLWSHPTISEYLRHRVARGVK